MRFPRELLLVAVAFPAAGEFLLIDQSFGGLECASCIPSVERAIGRMRGVRSASIDREKNVLRVHLEPGNTVRLEAIRDRLKSSGFSPADAAVRIQGRLVSAGREWTLDANLPGLVYRLVAKHSSIQWKSWESKSVTIAGRIATAAGSSPATELLEAEVSSAP